MKNLYKSLLVCCGVALTFSCSNLNTIPKFNEKDAFVKFVKTDYNVPEDRGTLNIPVSIASIAPVNTTVEFEITYPNLDGGSVSKAVEGENFTLDSKSLVFENGERTKNLVVKIVDLPKQYTGDFVFNIAIKSAKGLNLGAQRLCSITITDNNLESTPILASYTAKGVDNGAALSGGSESSWDAKILPNGNDASSVLLQGLTKALTDKVTSLDSTSFLATVLYKGENGSISGINIPAGQKLSYKGLGDNKFVFIGVLKDDKVSNAGNIEFSYENNVFTLKTPFVVYIVKLDENGSPVGDVERISTVSTLTLTKKAE